MKNWMFSPFNRIAGGSALGLGAVVLVITALIASFSNTHYPDGLSVKMLVDLPFWMIVVQLTVNWLSCTFIFWLLAKLLTKSHFRFIDLAGTQLLARHPYVWTALIGFSPQLEHFSLWAIKMATQPTATHELPIGDMIWSIFFFLLLLLLTIWMVALLFQSYKISTNLKGTKVILSFIGGFILSLIVSAVVSYFILSPFIDFQSLSLPK